LVWSSRNGRPRPLTWCSPESWARHVPAQTHEGYAQPCPQPVWVGVGWVTTAPARLAGQRVDEGRRTTQRTATDCASYARPRGASVQVSTALSSFVLLIRGLWVRSPRGPPPGRLCASRRSEVSTALLQNNYRDLKCGSYRTVRGRAGVVVSKPGQQRGWGRIWFRGYPQSS
jgi:hypothetical protein